MEPVARLIKLYAHRIDPKITFVSRPHHGMSRHGIVAPLNSIHQIAEAIARTKSKVVFIESIERVADDARREITYHCCVLI
jgi:hypothetical protein